MMILQEVLSPIVVDIWSSILAMDVFERDGGAELPSGATLAGCVHLAGEPPAAVVIECTDSVARHAAATMFAMDPALLTAADIRDAVGELANMAAGNLKASLPDPYQLSTPTVISGNDFRTHLPTSERVAQSVFDSAVGEFKVSVYEQTLAPKRHAEPARNSRA